MTCLSRLIDFLAICVICNDWASHSLLTNFMTMRLAYMIMNGVANIDSTILAKIGLSMALLTSLFCCASVNTTKPNSPACARYKPVRSAVPSLAPSPRANTVIMTSLNTTGTVVSNNTSGQRSKTIRQSSNMPMVMKNKPSKMSWKGRISVST